MLIRSNAPNRSLGARLQRMLGGEYHETCFCTCWPCCIGRRGTLQRSSVCDACRQSGAGRASFQRSAGRLFLQRVGPLLAPTDLRLRLRLLPSALLWRLGLAPSLGILAPLAPLASLLQWLVIWPVCLEERGLGPFLFSARNVPRLRVRRSDGNPSKRYRRREDKASIPAAPGKGI